MSGFFSDQLLDEIRSANSIYEVVSEYVPLKKSGRSFKGLCPFHTEKTPSFIVNPERQIAHCFGCGEGGNVFGFIMKKENISFPEAVRFLAQRRGIPIPGGSARSSKEHKGEVERLREANTAAAEHYRNNLVGAPGVKARAYLLSRGISREIIDGFSMGYAAPGWDKLARALSSQGFTVPELLQAGLLVPKSGSGHIDRFRNRLVFPISDAQGRVVGFGGRVMGEGEPKYLNSPETTLYHKGRVLYGLSHSREHIHREGFGIVVEGYFDFLMVFNAGCKNVVATSGTALTEGHIGLMRRYSDRWTLVFDGDNAGIRAAKRSLELFVEHGMFARVVLLPEGKDPDSFIRERGGEDFRRQVEAAENLMDFFIQRIIKDHRIGQVEGKVAAVREVVPVLAKVRGRVEQAEYVGMAAHRLAVKEEVLWSEVQAAASRNRGGRTSSAPFPVPAEPGRAAEVELVKTMLACGPVAAEVRAQLPLEDFESDLCRKVAGSIFAFLDRGVKEDFGERLQFDDESMNRLVASWLIASGPLLTEEEFRRVARDCLSRLTRRRVERESRLLQEKICRAEKAGEKETVNKLLAIKHDLYSQIQH